MPGGPMPWGSGGGSLPAPLLFHPLTASLINAQEAFTLNADERNAQMLVQLADTPPPGIPSALTLQYATVTLILQILGGASPSLAPQPVATPVSFGTNVVQATFGASLMALVTDQTRYECVFQAVWADGTVADFNGPPVIINNPVP